MNRNVVNAATRILGRPQLWWAFQAAFTVTLLLLAAYWLWPTMGFSELMVGLAATTVSTVLAAIAAVRGSGDSAEPGPISPPGVEGFERTHTPRELRSAQAHALDALTSLPDHVALLAIGASLLTSETPRLLAVLELGGLSDYNHRFGRTSGDAALTAVAGLLSTMIGDREMVARCSGSQFALLLESDSVGDSFRRLRAIQEDIACHSEATVKIATQTHAGLAWYPRHGLNMNTLLHRARAALSAARKRDRDCVIYSVATEIDLDLQQELTSDLELAVENGKIALNYQPLVPLDGNGPCGLEVLARWEHPVWGTISPQTFISLAEKGGFINRLTRRIVKDAVEQLARWHNQELDIRLSLNLSAHDLFDDTLPHYLSRICALADIDPALLTLEVTETAMISDVVRARMNLKRLRRLGISVVIDDFGTGYSSLSHLRLLPVDGIKIDKSFVKNLRGGSDNNAIVRVSIELAHSLGIKVTAEGVETEHIEAYLHEFECDTMQGFHICRPLGVEAVPGWLLGNTIRFGSERSHQHSLPFAE